MTVPMHSIPAPECPIFRIARGPDEPFSLPDWSRAGEDGTFGNRFDDPGRLIGHADTLAHLDEKLAPFLRTLGIDHLDLSSITQTTPRILTQLAARYIHERGFAGIRYTSKLGNNWECWAVFEGCFHHEMGYPGLPVNITPDDADLLRTARRFGLTIETIRGLNHVLRPWKDDS